ncbi:integrase, catalytic region, zinc finger, CCHC-type containing protein [Tanacetum coccineum]
MSNSNTSLQTQSSNALHNAIMKAGSKDRPPMLAPGNYVKWKSRIKRYIDTKPNNELIYYCLQNPPYTYQWAGKIVPVAEGSSETTTERKSDDKLMAFNFSLIQENLQTSNNKPSNFIKHCRGFQDNSPRINRGTGYDNQRAVNVAGARENVGTPVMQKSGIQCYNCKEYGHVSRECQKPKRVKDAAYHKEKMLLCKQEKLGFQLNAEQADWKDVY